MDNQSKYKLGKTGIYSIEQLRRHIQIFMEQDTLDPSTYQNVIIMTLLLHIYDKLDEKQNQERSN